MGKEKEVKEVKDLSKVNQFVRPKNAETPADFSSILTLAVGTGALVLESKICSWIAVFLWLSSLANIRSIGGDYKQLFSTFIFALMGIFMRYFGRQRIQG